MASLGVLFIVSAIVLAHLGEKKWVDPCVTGAVVSVASTINAWFRRRRDARVDAAGVDPVP